MKKYNLFVGVGKTLIFWKVLYTCAARRSTPRQEALRGIGVTHCYASLGGRVALWSPVQKAKYLKLQVTGVLDLLYGCETRVSDKDDEVNVTHSNKSLFRFTENSKNYSVASNRETESWFISCTLHGRQRWLCRYGGCLEVDLLVMFC